MTSEKSLRVINTVAPDKKMWHRSDDVLDLLTLGQVQMMKGEAMQNPYYLSQGCSIMLEIIVPMLKEKHTEGEKKTQNIRGFQTFKATDFYNRLSAARNLMNVGMDHSLSNRQEMLDISYRILTKLKKDILQTTNDLDFNFMSKPDPNEAWRGG